jgi:hypothetical protein
MLALYRHPIERQIAIAEQVGPVKAFAARTAFLISCGDPALEGTARRVLKARFGVDEIVCLATPLRALATPDPRALPWLCAWLARELRTVRSSIVAVAGHPDCHHFALGADEAAAPPTPADLEVAADHLRAFRLAPDVEALWLRAG